MKNFFTHKHIFAPFLVALALLTLPVMAQEAGEEVLTPNMTVNIKLNSALSDKETEFYSKIAQDIISRIPREVTLDEQMSKLREINKNHEHVNIVSYLPPTDDVNTDKLIQHFKVKFVFSDEEGAQTPEEAVINAETVGLKKPEPVQEPETSAQPTPEPGPADMAAVADTPEPDTKATQGPAKPETTRAPEPDAPERTSTRKPARKIEIPELQLAFHADETQLSLSQRREIMALVKKIRDQRSQQPEAYTFVVRSYNGPTGENTWLAEERLRAVTSLLRQQDINLARANVTEIFVHTNKDQFIEILPVN